MNKEDIKKLYGVLGILKDVIDKVEYDDLIDDEQYTDLINSAKSLNYFLNSLK